MTKPVHCKDREKYKAGTLVLIKNSKKLSKKGSKMEPNWTGPYIHEVLSKGTYRLSKPNPPFKVQARKYNMTRLKIVTWAHHAINSGKRKKKL